MEKQAIIAEGITPPEDVTNIDYRITRQGSEKIAYKILIPELEKHTTKRLADKAEDILNKE